MKRIAIIDNLVGYSEFCSLGRAEFSPSDISLATGGNTGNVAFVSGTRLSIENKQRVIGWGSNPEVVRRETDHIVICCANQIGAHVDLGIWAERLERFNLPVTLLGLGAQTPTYEEELKVPSGTLDFLEMVRKLDVSSCGCVGVRGHFTEGVLTDLGTKPVVTGCPSLFISPRSDIGRNIARRTLDASTARIAVAGGNPHHKSSSGLEPLLMQMAERNNGAYIVQHPDLMMGLGAGMYDERTEEQILKLLHVFEPHRTLDSLKDWFADHGYVFWDTGHWTQFLSHMDAVVGPRFHGVALGVQAGIPGVVLDIDNRTRELATTSAIKHFAAADFMGAERTEVIDSLAWSDEDGAKFDQNRIMRAQVLEQFLTDNELVPSAHVKALAGQ